MKKAVKMKYLSGWPAYYRGAIKTSLQNEIGIKEALANCSLEEQVVELDMASDEKGRRLPGKRC